MDRIIIYIFLAIISLFSLTIHECAHGYAAYALGDTTAKDAGRLSLNPLKHIDIIGLISLIVLKIGWAKPVPVNPYRLRNKGVGMLEVALCGPGANILLAVLFSVFLKLFINLDFYYPALFCVLGVQLNIGYAVFNLIPIPPLDGSRLLYLINSPKLRYYISKYERYSFFLLFILLRLGLMDMVISPIINYIYNILV